MAKAAKTAIKTKDARAAAEAKNWTKVIKAVRSPKTGAYTFKEALSIRIVLSHFFPRNKLAPESFYPSCSLQERLFSLENI